MDTERKQKLAKWILLESQALESSMSVTETLNMAREITRDAIELAKLIEEENKEIKTNKEAA